MENKSVCIMDMLYIRSGMYSILGKALERTLESLGIDMKIKCRETNIDGKDKLEIIMKYKEEN